MAAVSTSGTTPVTLFGIRRFTGRVAKIDQGRWDAGGAWAFKRVVVKGGPARPSFYQEDGMRHLLLLTIITLLISLACNGGESPKADHVRSEQTQATSRTSNNGDDIAIEQVLTQIKQALANISTRLEQGALPKLKSVTLTLQTTVTKDAGGKVKLFVISFGHKWEKEKSQELVLQLTPPPPGVGANVGAVSVTQQLEDAIIAAAQGYKNAEATGLKLQLTGVSESLNFTVSRSSNAGVSLEITPVTVDLSGDLSNKAIQKIVIVFGSIS